MIGKSRCRVLQQFARCCPTLDSDARRETEADANALHPSTLRDALIQVGLARPVQPQWTDLRLDEVFRNLRANRPDLDPVRLDRTRGLMKDEIRDTTVTDHEYLIDQLDLPDGNDRHVLAAAIHANAEAIVTKNLRDFPSDSLTPWGVEA